MTNEERARQEEIRQARFFELWRKCRNYMATPEEKQEMLRMQEEYWSERNAAHGFKDFTTPTDQEISRGDYLDRVNEELAGDKGPPCP